MMQQDSGSCERALSGRSARWSRSTNVLETGMDPDREYVQISRKIAGVGDRANWRLHRLDVPMVLDLELPDVHRATPTVDIESRSAATGSSPTARRPGTCSSPGTSTPA